MGIIGAPSRGSSARPQLSKASPLPLIVGIVGLLAGIALAVVTIQQVTMQPLGPTVKLPFAANSTIWVSLAGYLLTYFLVFGAFAWDRLAQRAGLRRDRNFWDKPGYSKALSVMCWVAAIIGLWHMWNLAYVLASEVFG